MGVPPRYSASLAGRDPLEAIEDSIGRLQTLVGNWPAERLEKAYAPGKWTGRQLLIHLAETEVAFGYRVRMALAADRYLSQPFNPDAWLACDSRLTAQEALTAFVALARMNLVLFRSLSPADRAKPLVHPEYGEMDVDWIIHTTAGHHIHHLNHLNVIDRDSSTS